MYKLEISKNVRKSLVKIPNPYFSKIKKAIQNLSYQPKPRGCKKLKGRDAYRIRVSNYRIIYEIHDKKLLIQVIAVGHRKDIYRQ